MSVRRENLFAFTEYAGYVNYPAFLSINRLADGSVGVAVRGRDTSGPTEIVLPPEEFERLQAELSGVR